MAFDLIKAIIPMAKRKAVEAGKILELVIVSNLANLTDEILTYLSQNDIRLSTSLDGPEFIHNKNRPRPGTTATGSQSRTSSELALFLDSIRSRR